MRVRLWCGSRSNFLAALALVCYAETARAEDMRFRSVTVGDSAICGAACPEVIAAEGEITNRTPAAFLEFVRTHAPHKNLHAIVFLHSPGGKVLASMELGRMLRRAGAAAVVARAIPDDTGDGRTHFTGARCFSACVYALMGGKKRVIPPESLVGIHRMYAHQGGFDPEREAEDLPRRYDNRGVVSALSRYSGMMGVSPDLIAKAEHISHDRVHIVTPAEIARWRLGKPTL